MSDPKTLESAGRWLEFYMEHKEPHSIGILVGNKKDLSENEGSCTAQQINDQSLKLKVP